MGVAGRLLELEPPDELFEDLRLTGKLLAGRGAFLRGSAVVVRNSADLLNALHNILDRL